MFPIGDSPNPRGIAWVTWILIAINVVVFLAYLPAMNQPADPNDPRLNEYLAMIGKETGASQSDLEAARGQLTEYDLVVYENGSRPAHPSWLDMLKSMFLHGGWMHLLGNMLFLWIYGNNTEHRFGRVLYLLAYLATGYAAAFGDMLLRPGSDIPAVGASGAISGVLGMYFIWFPHNKVRLLILMPPIVRVFELGARWVLGFYIVANNLLPVLLGGGGPSGVAYGAHIAGFIGGVVLAFGDNLRIRLGLGREREVEKKVVPSGAVAAAEAVARGDALMRAGAPQKAAAAYAAALRHQTNGDFAAAAHLGLARVLLEDLHQPTEAYQHLYDAIAAGPTPAQEAEARALLQRMRPRVRTIPTEATRW